MSLAYTDLTEIKQVRTSQKGKINQNEQYSDISLIQAAGS